jgi:adenylate cyclase
MRRDLFQTFYQQKRNALWAGLASAAIGLAALVAPWDAGLAALSFDLLSDLSTPAPPPDVVVVYMDEESRTRLRQPPQAPWNRALHAALLEELRHRGARLVAFDILCDEPWPDPTVDQQWAAAMRKHGKVLLASTLRESQSSSAPAVTRHLLPTESLREASQHGLVELPLETDGVIRRHYINFEQMPFAERAAVMLERAPPRSATERWIRFYGKPNSLAHASYHQVLEPRALPEDFFTNKIVFVGMAPIITYQGSKTTDLHRTPFSRWSGEQAPGVEIQATICANLLEGNWATRPHPVVEALMICCAGMLVGATAGFRFGAGLAALAILLIFVVLAAVILFAAQDLWFSWLIVPLVEAPVGIVFAASFHLRRMQQEKLKLEERISAAMADDSNASVFQEAPTVAESSPMTGLPPIPALGAAVTARSGWRATSLEHFTP